MGAGKARRPVGNESVEQTDANTDAQLANDEYAIRQNKILCSAVRDEHDVGHAMCLGERLLIRRY